MRRPTLLLPLLLFAAPAMAADVACEGAFGIDTSEARLKEIYGAANVTTGDMDGPEGSTILATQVFADDPEKRIIFVWWNEETFTDVSYIELPASDSIAGLSVGMTVKEVETLNGAPFNLTGFWWDYGGFASFQTGTLSAVPGDCYVQVNFNPHNQNTPEGLNVDAVSGDREVPSSEPLLVTLDARIEAITLGYAHPDFRDGAEPSDGEEVTEDTRG